MRRLCDYVNPLKVFPESGHAVPELGRKEIRELLRGAYTALAMIVSTSSLSITARDSSTRTAFYGGNLDEPGAPRPFTGGECPRYWNLCQQIVPDVCTRDCFYVNLLILDAPSRDG